MLVALPKLCQPILPTEQCSVHTKKLKTGFEWTEVFQKHSIKLSLLKWRSFKTKVFETANACRHLRHLRPIYEFCFEYQAVFGHFPTNPNIISDDFWRLPKISEDCRKWLSPIKYEIFTNLKKTEIEVKIPGIIETSAFEALEKENVLEVFKT